jgi:hypothetical protein
MAELNRRQLLKLLGMGSGVLTLETLSGCTLPLRWDSSPDAGKASSMGLGKANLDRGLAQATLDQWKKVLRAQHGMENVSPSEVERRITQARDMTLRLLDHIDQIGLSKKIDRSLMGSPEEIAVSEEEIYEATCILQDAIPADELQELESRIPRRVNKSAVLDPILKEGGVSQHFRNAMAQLNVQTSALRTATSEAEAGQFVTGMGSNCSWGVGVCAVLFTLLLLTCGDECSQSTTDVVIAVCFAGIVVSCGS